MPFIYLLELEALRLQTLSQAVGRSVVENLPDSAGGAGDMGSVPESGRCPGAGNGNPL